MEKSLINEFKNSSSTLFHSTVLGTNSLLAQRSPKEHDIFKSRIAHLPADHREDLTRKLDFVVVFQAIELERLYQEIAFLRGRLRQQDGRSLHTSSYQIQIRELMQKCNKIENEKYSYREELSQTKDASENIFNQLSILKSRYADVDFCVAEKYKLEKARNEQLCLEIEKWKSRYNSLERIKGEELEGYKRLLETQKESLMNREAKDILARFELEKEELLGRLRDRKQQLDQRELEIKKLQNYYEQLQVRNREDNSKMQNYEQKVALLSQETFRLNELVRAKHEEIRNMKLIYQQDFSLRMSRFTSLDQTKNHLNDKVRLLQDENDDLREENKLLSDDLIRLKRRLSQVQRLEYQVKEAKTDSQSKFKALERKDKRLIALEQEIKQMHLFQDQLNEVISQNQGLKLELISLQQRLDIKIEELREVKEQQIGFLRWRDDFNQKLTAKINQFQQNYQRLEQQFAEMRNTSDLNSEKSNNNELKVKEYAIQLKENDYRISSLQNQLKQMEIKGKRRQLQNKEATKEIEEHLFAQRRNFEQKIKELQTRNRQNQHNMRQVEAKWRDSQGRAREIEAKFKDFQSANSTYELKARNLQAECNDLQAWGRSLQSKNHHLDLHIRQLELHMSEMQEQNIQLKNFLEQQHQFYRNAEERYFQIGQELKSLQIRLQNIEKILIALKTNITLKLKSAQESDYKLHLIEQRYEELYQWFMSLIGTLDRSTDSDRFKDSPIKTPYHHLFGNVNENSRFSNSSRDETNYQSSQLQRARSMERTRQNINTGNREQQISLDLLLKHILLCVQVESLRKRVGDKNARVESMRTSNVVKGYPQSNGFYSTREPSAGKKANIYY